MIWEWYPYYNLIWDDVNRVEKVGSRMGKGQSIYGGFAFYIFMIMEKKQDNFYGMNCFILREIIKATK